MIGLLAPPPSRLPPPRKKHSKMSRYYYPRWQWYGPPLPGHPVLPYAVQMAPVNHNYWSYPRYSQHSNYWNYPRYSYWPTPVTAPIPQPYVSYREYRPYHPFNKGGTGRFEQTVNIQSAHNVHMPVHGDRHLHGDHYVQARNRGRPRYRPQSTPPANLEKKYTACYWEDFAAPYRRARSCSPDWWRRYPSGSYYYYYGHYDPYWDAPPSVYYQPSRRWPDRHRGVPPWAPPRRRHHHHHGHGATAWNQINIPVGVDVRVARERDERLDRLVRNLSPRRGRSRVRTSWADDGGRCWMTSAVRSRR